MRDKRKTRSVDPKVIYYKSKGVDRVRIACRCAECDANKSIILGLKKNVTQDKIDKYLSTGAKQNSVKNGGSFVDSFVKSVDGKELHLIDYKPPFTFKKYQFCGQMGC